MNIHIYIILGLPQWLNGKESAFSAGDTGDMDLLSQGQEDPLEEGIGNPLQYSC